MGCQVTDPQDPPGFLEGAAAERLTHKLKWLTQKPLWIPQWPLSREKLKALNELVEEQLILKSHIEETSSPWNSPVFVIKKPGKDKWGLLYDLKEISNIIEDMGSLQPGMPSPTMLPQNWQLAVLDIKDCFFHIPLHPEDALRFAFSVPSINREAPMKRYHWKVLPQGLKCSPFICQHFVAALLSPVRAQCKDAIILHYIDDILVCGPNNTGERELTSPRDLTPEAKDALKKIEKALAERQANRYNSELPFRFIILGKLPHLHGLIFQWIEGRKDSLLIIEWVFLSHQRSKTITKLQELMAQLIRKARLRLRELSGCDFTCIFLLVKLSKEGKASTEKLTKEMLEHLQNNAELQLALDRFRGQISVHSPSHKLFHEEFKLIPWEKRSRRPVKALMVFTDVLGASHKSVMTWRDPLTQHWEADIQFVEGSPQIAELDAVVRAFEKFSEPINLVTDSAYVAGVVSRAEQAVLKEIDNEHLFQLISRLIYLVKLQRGTDKQTFLLPLLKKRLFQTFSNRKIYPSLSIMRNPIQVVILVTLNAFPSVWIIPQPRQNIWVTLAQTLQQENICLSTAAAKNPKSTCLVNPEALQGAGPGTAKEEVPQGAVGYSEMAEMQSDLEQKGEKLGAIPKRSCKWAAKAKGLGKAAKARPAGRPVTRSMTWRAQPTEAEIGNAPKSMDANCEAGSIVPVKLQAT
ncbi:PREDICTED: LOW QUALITY PROTEIN: endogenous retrovirus group K member 113 Pol protein-like [Pseudopodoces humilis]|uniref:LOW QUALITY PROTEIN: endogenous retrovirus group K member 113 Pol protein-like n=1 Tax=Pseudopodoces humilis TaxID=181119 RepID=UPI0006B74C81|nr:PREDICTED: LOW QUALITY PROTEIN: endogenous retrovirus group K member 113 Pol protein-like [Pseudopodoces humilis]